MPKVTQLASVALGPGYLIPGLGLQVPIHLCPPGHLQMFPLVLASAGAPGLHGEGGPGPWGRLGRTPGLLHSRGSSCLPEPGFPCTNLSRVRRVGWGLGICVGRRSGPLSRPPPVHAPQAWPLKSEEEGPQQPAPQSQLSPGDQPLLCPQRLRSPDRERDLPKAAQWGRAWTSG